MMKLISITLLMHVTPALTLLTDLFYTEMYELSLDARDPMLDHNQGS